jgi:GNAT superfamily N-acetyltransferase
LGEDVGTPTGDAIGGPSMSGPSLTVRRATLDDVQLLAALNHRLIQDEGHRNPMSVVELADRMRGWLGGAYVAHVFELAGAPVAYALWRDDGDAIYLRQFFVDRAHRRAGVGRAAIRLLLDEVFPRNKRVTVDVLIGNDGGRRFWEAVGFRPYSLTLERLPPDAPSGPVGGG